MAVQTRRRSDGKLFVGGRYVDTDGGATEPVHEKATGREIGRFATTRRWIGVQRTPLEYPL
jgi:hypothetical protein